MVRAWPSILVAAALSACDGGGGAAAGDAGADPGGLADAGDSRSADAATSDAAGGDEGIDDLVEPADVAPEDAADADHADDVIDSAEPSDTVDAAADTAQCTALDEQTLSSLAFGLLSPSVPIEPGGMRDFNLYKVECCYFLEPVDACVQWSVSPEGGAEIDAEGVLSVGAEVPTGTTYTVKADVEDGKRVLTIDAVVTTAESNPLLGNWTETAQIACDGGEEVAPEESIGELAFFAGGEINVTWFPFEVYVDYWGQYTFDLEAGTISIAIVGGNYVPPDFEGEGKLELTPDGQLLLKDLWLGTPQGGKEPPRCGHRFE